MLDVLLELDELLVAEFVGVESLLQCDQVEVSGRVQVHLDVLHGSALLVVLALGQN